MNTLIHAALRWRTLTLLLAALLAAAGLHAWFQLPIDAFPDISPTQAKIILKIPGMTPEEVELRVVRPIEQELLSIPKKRMVRSVSKYGIADITLDFEEGTDIYWARQQVSERLSGVMGDLPTGVSGGLAPITTPLSELYMFTVEGENFSLADKRRALDWTIRPELRSRVVLMTFTEFGRRVERSDSAGTDHGTSSVMFVVGDRVRGGFASVSSCSWWRGGFLRSASISGFGSSSAQLSASEPSAEATSERAMGLAAVPQRCSAAAKACHETWPARRSSLSSASSNARNRSTARADPLGVLLALDSARQSHSDREVRSKGSAPAGAGPSRRMPLIPSFSMSMYVSRPCTTCRGPTSSAIARTRGQTPLSSRRWSSSIVVGYQESSGLSVMADRPRPHLLDSDHAPFSFSMIRFTASASRRRRESLELSTSVRPMDV